MRRAAFVLAAAVMAVLVAGLVRGLSPDDGTASSHREAPLISEDPTADNTDLYAFRALDAPNALTIISNWIPGEDPAAGPNYFRFSSTARYHIYIDRSGDAVPDVTYRFQFRNKPGQLFLGNTVQSYTVTKIAGGKSQVVARGDTPPNNIGPKQTPNYRSLAAKGVLDMAGGGKVFAGQREDAFFGDIGAIFDLVTIRKAGTTGDKGGGKDFFAGYNVHAIALQIPISQLDDKDHVVGIWSTTDRQKVVVRGGKARKTWVQVSRLGNPLVNEVVIPTNLKDLWNSLPPTQDKRFAKYVTDPLLAKVMNQLYKLKAPETGRTDLVQVFATGVPKLNYSGAVIADMLRINLSIPPTPQAKRSRMGVLGGDTGGFPNGRRLIDDVIDIGEQAMAGFLKGNKVPLGDGVDANDVPSLGGFPYEGDPFSGYENAKGTLQR
jgi:hypothetical protein